MIRRRMNRFGLSIFFMLVVLSIFLITGFFVILISLLASQVGLLDRFGFRAAFPMLLAVLGASAIVGSIVSMMVGRVPLRPIREIINATNRLAAGDFSARITTLQTPELRELSYSFNRMAAELGSLELLRSDFINNFSHEFKTPIVSIKGFADLLKMDDLPKEERNEYLDIIASESARLAAMATNVLNLSRVENQTIVTDKQPFDLTEQLRRCILMMQAAWERKHIQFEVELGEVQITANAELLNQVWVNLFDNAIKFSDDGGLVEVALCREDDEAVLSIRDDGMGIPPADIPHVFDKFYQSDTSRTVPGNGLGLALAKKIVLLHEGSIQCQSEPENGTVFTVRLPIAPAM